MYFQTLFSHTGTLTWIITGIAGAAFLTQGLIYLLVYLRCTRKSSMKQESAETPPVSVVICARNEEENLRRFLPLVLEQDYPDFEVVVVDDCSTDDTGLLLAELTARYKRLRYTTITPDKKFTHGKKLALTVGIKSARHDILLLTDADCYPGSENWIRGMTGGFSRGAGMVLGYGGYEKRKGLLNLLIRYETVNTALRYLGYALKGYPVMGVGRNIAYRKELFFANKGFAAHYHLASGDDDLFVNEVAGQTKVSVVFDPASHTISLPKTGFRAWFVQKKRHVSAGRLYRKGARLRIAADWISSVLFYLPALYLAVATDWHWLALGSWFLLTLLKSIILKLFMVRLDEKDLLLPSFLIEPLLPYIYFVIRAAQVFDPKPNQWS
ncbi:MAG: glycosyltransferase [Bacteroidota bacterium]